jgi:hypothetical protein
MKTNQSLIILTIVSLALAFMYFEKYYTERANSNRLNKNFESLAGEFTEFKKQAVTIGILDMRIKEVKKSFPELEKQIKDDFNVKLKHAIQYSETQTIVNHTFKTTVRDSFVCDTVPVKFFVYKDKWIDFSAFSDNDTFTLDKNEVPVPLKQIIHREPWKLKYLPPWNWGKRKILQEIKTDNPYAVIEFARTINFNK